MGKRRLEIVVSFLVQDCTFADDILQRSSKILIKYCFFLHIHASNHWAIG